MNLTETQTWEEGIYQLETTDPVEGGPGGIDNRQAQQLANRTKFLKGQQEQHASAADPHPQYMSTAESSAAIAAAISELVGSSPDALNTLNELAAALANDPNFASTMNTALAAKTTWAVVDAIIQAAGLTANHADPSQLLQALGLRYAALTGNAGNVFSVAAATAGAHAVSRDFGDGRFAAKAGSTAQPFSAQYLYADEGQTRQNSARTDASWQGAQFIAYSKAGAAVDMATTAYHVQDCSNAPQWGLKWDGTTQYFGLFDSSGAFIWGVNATTGAFLGTPTAPTASYGTSTTQLATTAFADAMRDVPSSSSTTLVLSDRGKSVDTTQNTYVPANTFSVGHTVTITNVGSGSLTIVQSSGVTLRQAGTTNTGNRTLAGYGVATLRCIANNTFIISGAGLS